MSWLKDSAGALRGELKHRCAWSLGLLRALRPLLGFPSRMKTSRKETRACKAETSLKTSFAHAARPCPLSPALRVPSSTASAVRPDGERGKGKASWELPQGTALTNAGGQTPGRFPCLAPGVAFVFLFEAVTGIMRFNRPPALLLPYLVVSPNPIIS